MKRFIAPLLCFCIQAAYSQKVPLINGSDAKKHFGEVVRIHDSLISGKIYKDSIAVLEFGDNVNSHHFTVLYIPQAGAGPTNEKLINFFKVAKSTIEGLLFPVNDNPTIIIHNLSKVRTDYRPD